MATKSRIMAVRMPRPVITAVLVKQSALSEAFLAPSMHVPNS